MKKQALGLIICALTVSGCVSNNSSIQNTTRSDTAALMFTQSGSEIDALHHQASVLDQLAGNIVRRSTMRGAALGGAVGCGVGLATGNGVQRCLIGAAALGAAGAAVGNAKGKADVATKIQDASPEALSRDLQSANDQMAFISEDLGQVLATQDHTISQLTLARQKGRLSPKTYRAKIDAIYQDRKRLADSLDQSHVKSQKAAKTLKQASLTGGKTVKQQAAQARKLERSIQSERARVDLLSLSALRS